MLMTAWVSNLTTANSPNNIAFFDSNLFILYGVLGVIILGLIMLAFTPYRKVIGYFLAGMTYWLLVEGLAWGLRVIFSFETLHGYVFGIAFTFIPIIMGLNWLENRRKNPNMFNNSLKNPLTFFQGTRKQKVKYPTILMAGQRPFMMEQDTDFCQHFIRHTSVFDYEN